MSSADNWEKLYPLSHDQSEFERLNGQHVCIKLIFGGLYPYKEIVQEVLAPTDGQSKRILDLGSGSGIWCIEMARELPHAHVVGMDLAPSKVEDMPPNCEFIIDDFDKPLTQYYKSFDLIHWRFSDGAVKDYRATLIEAQKCLKPGGMIIVITGNRLLTENGLEFYPPWTSSNPEGSWYQRFLDFSWLGMLLNGSDMERTFEVWSKGIWSHGICDPATCGAAFVRVPVGTWRTAPNPEHATRLQRIGKIWRDNLATLHRFHHKSLSMAGRTPEDLKHLHQRIDEELESGEKRLSHLVRVGWGRAPGGSNQVPLAKSSHFGDIQTISKDLPQIFFASHDEEEWSNANRSLPASMTPDMISLETKPGFDIVEM